MKANDPNIEMLQIVADGLGALLDDVVFLGGCAAGLLITDPASPRPRETNDVDVIVEITTMHDYHNLAEKLRQRGFCEDTSDDAPMCRWMYHAVVVDVMPTNEAILGFSNQWYPEALKQAQRITLANGVSIQIVSAPHFLATKLEAFYGRGDDDYMASHDLEDLIAVLDGRASIIDEVTKSSESLRAYLAEEFGKLLRNDEFHDALPCQLPPDSASQERITLIASRMEAISNLRHRYERKNIP
jgi:hypothetical protein